MFSEKFELIHVVLMTY